MCLRFALGRGFYDTHFLEKDDGYIVKTNCVPRAFASIMERATLDKYSYENDVIADKFNSPYFKPYKINVELVNMFEAMEQGMI